MDPLLTQQVAILVELDQRKTAAPESDKAHWQAAADCISGSKDMAVALRMLTSGTQNTRIPERREAFSVAAELARASMIAETYTEFAEHEE
jgi:hypothetical protein